jgi:Holliday junction resolvasome RuvABC endonuclease subunit
MVSVPYYIGLDQALNNTGIAVTNGKKIVTTQIISTSKESSLDRLIKLETVLTKLLQSLKPKKVYMESIYIPASRLKACSALIRVETTIQLLLARKSVEFLSMPASNRLSNSWPKQLKIKGSKEYCAEFLKPILPPGKISDHETDAVGILWGGLVLDKKQTIDAIMKAPIMNVNAKEYRADPNSIRNCFV